MAVGDIAVPAPVKFLRDLFGGDFEAVDGTVTATTSDQAFLGSNPEAVMLVIVNLGTDSVFVRPKAPASSTAGIQLSAAGGAVTFMVRDDGQLPTFDWHVIANSATQPVYYLRLQRYRAV